MSDVKRYEAVHLRYDDNNIRYGDGCEIEVVLASDYATLEAENAKLRAELELRAVPDALREAVEYLDSNRFNEIGAGSILHRAMRDALVAPSAPKANDPVKQMLLESLTDSLELMETLCAFEGDTIRKARAAIAAARKGEGE